MQIRYDGSQIIGFIFCIEQIKVKKTWKRLHYKKCKVAFTIIWKQVTTYVLKRSVVLLMDSLN